MKISSHVVPMHMGTRKNLQIWVRTIVEQLVGMSSAGDAQHYTWLLELWRLVRHLRGGVLIYMREFIWDAPHCEGGTTSGCGHGGGRGPSRGHGGGRGRDEVHLDSVILHLLNSFFLRLLTSALLGATLPPGNDL